MFLASLFEFLEKFKRHQRGTLSESYTKTGPGRKHKQGEQKYVHAQLRKVQQ